jgi:hypothetical protein
MPQVSAGVSRQVVEGCRHQGKWRDLVGVDRRVYHARVWLGEQSALREDGSLT